MFCCRCLIAARIGDPSDDGLGALDVQQVTDALDPALLDTREEGAEQLCNLLPQGLSLGADHRECRLGDRVRAGFGLSAVSAMTSHAASCEL